jgi:hypothetical protein
MEGVMLGKIYEIKVQEEKKTIMQFISRDRKK